MSIPKEHVHITFLTPWIVFVGILGFQTITLRCKTPCSNSINVREVIKCSVFFFLNQQIQVCRLCSGGKGMVRTVTVQRIGLQLAAAAAALPVKNNANLVNCIAL